MTNPPKGKVFRDLNLAVAIDTSGSTAGDTLAAEISAVGAILQSLSKPARDKVPILPWSDESGGVRRLAHCSSLKSGGGTDPGVLYRSSASLAALQASDLWFLLTDGQIYDNLVADFAIRTTQLSLHNRGCVIIIFGSIMQGPPAECDISVGKAAYALAPDCLFLFHDKDTSRLVILQAKGAFRKLFSRHGKTVAQPKLNYYTNWVDLPHMSYEDLARIEISPKQQVGQDEMILHNEAVLNIPDLYSGAAETETVETLLKNQDNLKSLVMAEMMRGRGEKLQEWLDSQQATTPKMTKDRVDLNGAAQAAVSSLLNIWGNVNEFPDRTAIQLRLQAAHTNNRKALSSDFDTYQEVVSQVHKKNTYLAAARTQSTHNRLYEDRSLGSNDKLFLPRHSSSQSQSLTAGWDDVDDNEHNHFDCTPRPAYPCFLDPSKREITAFKRTSEIFLPGFKRAANGTNEHKGKCMLCLDTALLTILLTTENEEDSTQNFPRRGSGTVLAFPLAMSSFAETNILSYFVCCDACAFHLVRNFTAPPSERVTAALPLVDIETNKDAWCVSLDKAFKGRFSHDCILQVFISSLDQKLEANRERIASDGDKESFRSAASWLQRELPNHAIAAPLLSPAFNKSKLKRKHFKTLSVLLEDDAFIDPAAPSNKNVAMLRYPMQGFAVIMRLLSLRGVPVHKIQQFVFLRLVFEITTTVLTEEQAIIGKPDKVELRIMDEPLPVRPKLSREAPRCEFDSTLASTTLLASIPAQTLVDRKLLSFETFSELRKLVSTECSQNWRVAEVDLYLNKLHGLKDKPKDPVKALNILKEDGSLQIIFDPTKR